MGLDMYAYTFPAELVDGKGEVDVQVEGVEPERLHYWRKHHDLHGWMANLYKSKGGEDPDFNCNSVRLNLEDLDELEKAVKEEEGAVLPATTGFFFGNNPPDDESRADDLEFIRKAREAIAQGKAVFYDSWW